MNGDENEEKRPQNLTHGHQAHDHSDAQQFCLVKIIQFHTDTSSRQFHLLQECALP